MIIHYREKTGEILGTSNGYKVGKVRVCREGIDESEVSQLVLSRDFLRANKELASDITRYKVVKAKGDKSSFQLDKSKKEAVKVEGKENICGEFLLKHINEVVKEEVKKAISDLKKDETI